MQEFLPGMRPDRVAEQRRVVPPRQGVAARRLLVGDALRQIGDRLDLVIDDRAVGDRGSHDPATILAQDAEQRLETFEVDDARNRFFTVHWAESLSEDERNGKVLRLEL